MTQVQICKAKNIKSINPYIDNRDVEVGMLVMLYMYKVYIYEKWKNKPMKKLAKKKLAKKIGKKFFLKKVLKEKKNAKKNFWQKKDDFEVVAL